MFSFTKKATLVGVKLGIKFLISSRNVSFSLVFELEFAVNQESNCSRFKFWGFWVKYSDTLRLFCAKYLEIAVLNL